MSNTKVRIIALAYFILFLGWGTVQAQGSDSIEEIVVTATKRATVLQDTPFSVQALGAETLKDLGADDFIDFFSQITSLSQTGEGPGSRRYAVRGVQSIGEPQVGLYYDEIPIAGLPGDNLDSGHAQLDLKLWDVERVEVLKGPQGTLYGQGSMGGTLRVISKRPRADKIEAAAEAVLSDTRYGDINYGVNGMINIPIIKDKLAIRGAVYHRDEEGFIDEIASSLPGFGITQTPINNANFEETTGGRVSVLYTPNEDTTLTGIYYFQRMDTGTRFETFPTFATSDNPVGNVFTDDFFNDDVDMFNVIADYDGWDWASVTATGSYIEREAERFDDTTRFVISGVFGCDETNFFVSCFGAPIVPTVSMDDQSVKAWSSEFRLTSKQEGPLQWTAGFFWQKKRTFRRGQVGIADAEGVVTFDDNRDMNARIFARTNYGHSEQIAFFGEASYEIMDRLTATVGLRWFDTSRDEDQNLVQPFFGNITGFLPTQEFGEKKLIKKFHLGYEINEDALVYFQAAEGFRLGGPNQPGGFNASAAPFDSDSLWNYELGWKSAWADDKFILNGAVYYIDWSEIQIQVTDITGAFDFIGNTGDADIIGFEIESTLRPVEGLELSAGLTHSKARLNGTQVAPTGGILPVDLQDGDRMANVPDWQFNTSAIYRFPVFGSYEGMARFGWNYISSSNTEHTDVLVGGAPNPSFYRKGSYHLASLRLGVSGDAWDASVFVNNLFDNNGTQSARLIDNEPIRVVIPRPRTIGVNFQYYFDGE
ncbi:MAG: TonB-dependent receptor [Gammaproteobacteria bacterium]|jgi:iron complex outermembrane recepter protein|nr:TonB-dependent receptor [Gammaproteobacteria bacterium]